MTASQVEEIVLELAPLAASLPGDVNGIVYGPKDREVSGVAVTWTPTVEVLSRAAAAGFNFVVTHEWPWFTTGESDWFTVTAEDEKPANIARRAIVDRNKMTLCRCHSNWDDVRADGIIDSLARALEFYAELHTSRFLRVYQASARTLGQLAMDVKARLGLPRVRVAGDGAMVVERVGVAVGGLAQSPSYIDELVANEAQAVIVGEAIDYSVRVAVDSGIGFIETSHVGSENPGMRNMARLLRQRLPRKVSVEFLDAGHPWIYL